MTKNSSEDVFRLRMDTFGVVFFLHFFHRSLKWDILGGSKTTTKMAPPSKVHLQRSDRGWQEGVGWVEGADGEGGEGASLPKLSISQGVGEAGMARGEKGGEGIWGEMS